DAAVRRSARRGQGAGIARFAAALGRYGRPRAFLVFIGAAALTACATSAPREDPYRVLERADFGPVPPATGTPVSAADARAPAGRAPGAGGQNGAALNLRRPGKAGPAASERAASGGRHGRFDRCRGDEASTIVGPIGRAPRASMARSRLGSPAASTTNCG